MIVKIGENLPWSSFKRRNRVVKAHRMREDFLYETASGWVKGCKGQWLVELGEKLRCNLDHEAFIRCYKPAVRRGGSH